MIDVAMAMAMKTKNVRLERNLRKYAPSGGTSFARETEHRAKGFPYWYTDGRKKIRIPDRNSKRYYTAPSKNI
jgi:hypothetical protein